MIKAVIFDFDGTLMDTLPGIAHFCNTALASLGLEAIETEKFKYFVGNGRTILVERTLEHRNALTEENLKKAIEIYDAEYGKDILFGTVVYDGIMELLQKLKNDGYKLGILTNKPHDVAVMIIKKVFGDMFDNYYGQIEGVPIKPSPEGAIKLADEFGVDVSECAFVGDTIVDVTTGNNACMYSVGVLWGFREEDELKAAKAIAKEPLDVYEIIKKVK